ATVGAAGWEWAGFAGGVGSASRGAATALLAAVLLVLWVTAAAITLLLPAVLWWLGLALALSRLQPQLASAGVDRVLLPLGLLVLAAPWLALVRLHGDFAGGPYLVLGLMLMIAVADSAAFFVGRRFGRRKLAPRLSPGKTWAGFFGALAAAGLGLLLTGLVLGLGAAATAELTLLGVVTVAVSVVGDLFESWLKRRQGVKDSGALLPGHGGVLDRIDSMTAAAPVFALGLVWLGLVQ
ncbi:phosphatidate cytidylyltransferase, partial [Thiohalocapsa sp.]|uniref:phosphatidate cytidylyltransferase n=1 Tax=Thiohalocapsa sp. TaxID=2497641 RepID=UPI0025CD8ABB